MQRNSSALVLKRLEGNPDYFNMRETDAPNIAKAVALKTGSVVIFFLSHKSYSQSRTKFHDSKNY